MGEKILLGFQVASGESVYVGVHHLAIFGMTQLSGKTTALEALISRSGLRAIAFKTKRGEAGFTQCNLLVPYYKPRADWQFVEGLVNVALGEKVKYEPGMRYAIMKVCRGRKDLREIRQAALDMAKESRREFMKSVYEKLAAYLDIVVPELEKWRFSEQLELKEGVNVMDLSGMCLETQHLVIASTIEYAFSFLDHVVVIIPEAWETIPQGKMTPVKWVAQQFIRKGAAIGNYLWLDSQDIAGIDKTPLRQCDNWLMGRMKEAHEVERILKQLLGLKVPKEDIQTLPVGHFYAAIGNEVKKVYVLPAGVPEDVGRRVAQAELSSEYVRDNFLKKSRVLEDEDLTYKPLWEEEKRKREKVEEERNELQQKLERIEKDVGSHEKIKEGLPPLQATNNTQKSDVPSEIAVTTEQPILTVQKRAQPLTLDDSSLEGKIAIVYAEGKLPDKAFTTRNLNEILEGRFGSGAFKGYLGPACNKLVAWGFFEKVKAGNRWDYRVRIQPEVAPSKGLLKEVEV
jgi:hypothetical protein